MPRPKVNDKKIHKNIRLKKSMIEEIKQAAKQIGVTEISIIEQGITLIIKQLENKKVG